MFTIIAESSLNEPDLTKVQITIRRLRGFLNRLEVKDIRDIFRKIAGPVFDEILSWQQGEEEEIKPTILKIIEVPAPVLPIKQYILIAFYIGFLIGNHWVRDSNIEYRFREKEFLTKSKKLVSLNYAQPLVLKVDYLELSFLVFCFLFLSVSILENRNLLFLRFKLLLQTIKQVESKRNKDYSFFSPHSVFLFEIYG